MSLGTVTGLSPLRSMKGNALLGMTKDSPDVVDVLPSLLHRVVVDFKHKETKHKNTHNGGYGLPQSAVPYRPIQSRDNAITTTELSECLGLSATS